MSFRIRSPSTRPDGPPLFVCNAAVPRSAHDAPASDDGELRIPAEWALGIDGLAGLERELSELLKTSVDVVPAALLEPGVRTTAEAEAIAL